MKVKFFVTLVILFVGFGFINHSSAQVQDYKSAIGIRLGYPLSLSYKTFISNAGAVEGILGYRNWSYYSWFSVGALYEHHMPISAVDGLAWYVGGGAQAYFWSFDKDYYLNSSDFATFSFGLMGALGLDYKFANIPLNISADWLPTFVIGGEFLTGFGGSYGGLGVRYTFR